MCTIELLSQWHKINLLVGPPPLSLSLYNVEVQPADESRHLKHKGRKGHDNSNYY